MHWDEVLFEDTFPGMALNDNEDLGRPAYRALIDFSQPYEHFSRSAEHFVYMCLGVAHDGHCILAFKHNMGEAFMPEGDEVEPLISLTVDSLEKKWLPMLDWK